MRELITWIRRHLPEVHEGRRKYLASAFLATFVATGVATEKIANEGAEEVQVLLYGIVCAATFVLGFLVSPKS
jgi:hypothetical protein